MVDRDYILKRIKSKSVTVGEFNWDRLEAPRLTMLLTPWEIQELENISYSLRLSAQLKKKYELIDQILRPRGFRKFINGTNRMCYEYIEDKSFMLKVGVDAVGVKDSPWEFKNQFIFKPFVPKVFEVSPRGTLGLFERVNPITNEEEFRAVAEDIYTVINEVFIGEYVLADIGTKFFMNWGIREGFGPVLLDFPYVYKLDGKKLFCNTPDPHSTTGYCNGAIDYDEGYNFLVCTKCGKQYKASDLRFEGETRKIIIREKGGYKMKVSVSGGNKAVKKTIKVNEDGKFSEVKTMPTKTKVETAPKIDKTEKVEEQKVAPQVKEEPEDKKRVVQANELTMAVNGVGRSDPTPEIISPIKFVSEEEKMKTMETILNHINEIRALSGFLTDDEALDLSDIFLDLFTELEHRPNKLKPDVSSFKKYIEKCSLLIDRFEDADKEEAFGSFTKEVVDAYLEYKGLSYSEDEEIDEEDDEEEDIIDEGEESRGFCLVSGMVHNLKDLDPEQPSKKVIIIVDDAENFIFSSSHEIIAIENVDHRPVNSVAVVSNEWLNSTQERLKALEGEDDIEDNDEDETIETVNGEEVE